MWYECHIIILFHINFEVIQRKQIQCAIKFNDDRHTSNYRVSPMYMQESLRDYHHIFYMDSSVRLIYTGNLSHTKSQIEQTGGILQMARAHHSIFATTHQNLYRYFGSDIDKTKHTGQ